jgi:AraC family transcriptional regulator
VERGGYRTRIGKQEFLCAKNALLVVPAGRFQEDIFGASETTSLLVDVSALLLQRLEEFGATISDAVMLADAESSSLASLLIRELKDTDSVSGLIFESLLLNILATAFRAHRSTSGPRVPSWLADARGLLRDSLSEPVTINSVADGVGVHPAHLSREFHRFYKISAGEYLRRARVEHAANLLKTSDMPLSEIALAAGFADQSHFCKVFRRVTRLSPLQFRRLNKSC